MRIAREITRNLPFAVIALWTALAGATDSSLCSLETLHGYRVDLTTRPNELSLPLNLLKFTGTLEDQRERFALIQIPHGETVRATVGSSIGVYHGAIAEIQEETVVIVENGSRCKSYGGEPCKTSPRCRELRLGEDPSARQLEAYRRRRANPTEEDLKVCCN